MTSPQKVRLTSSTLQITPGLDSLTSAMKPLTKSRVAIALVAIAVLVLALICSPVGRHSGTDSCLPVIALTSLPILTLTWGVFTPRDGVRLNSPLLTFRLLPTARLRQPNSLTVGARA